MFTVRIDVGDVVDEIDDARNQTEQGKAAKGAQEWFELKKLLVEDERKEDKAVFSSTGGGAWF